MTDKEFLYELAKRLAADPKYGKESKNANRLRLIAKSFSLTRTTRTEEDVKRNKESEC